ncbi:sugar phosphate isomerase/epimerase family protein [Paenibacillus sp. GCM10027628]|uniref:sugar phosphate isomerase/epimerase family protein n=1 Tax=Paenibacillus sp. GCM10027628 TaxID=3273413 RepID=UPI003625991C
MQYNICTISFRHELVSFRELVRFAHRTGFSGIELWGGHARSLLANQPLNIASMVEDMEQDHICVSMISDYVNLFVGPEQFEETVCKWRQLIEMANLFKTRKIRIFAGNMASGGANDQDWALCAEQLRILLDLAMDQGIYTVIETHPGTLADTLDSTIRLIQQTDHDALRVNLDFLHIWESGCEPMEALFKLKPWTMNYHLKNVQARSYLSVFEPNNVYSPNGLREGMVALAEGVVDYKPIIQELVKVQSPYLASLEWFGYEPYRQLETEIRWLKEVEQSSKCELNSIL